MNKIAKIFAIAILAATMVSCASRPEYEKLTPNSWIIDPHYRNNTAADDVILRVNKEQIYRRDLDAVIEKKFGYQHQSKQISEEVYFNLAQKSFQEILEAELVFQAAMKTDVPDLAQIIESRYLRLINSTSNPEMFSERLRKHNISPEQLKAKLAAEIHQEAFLQQNLKPESFAVTDAEIAEYYNQYPEKFSKPGQVQMQEIFIPYFDMKNVAHATKMRLPTDDEQTRCLDKISEIYEQLDKNVPGHDFESLARKYSKSKSAESGGHLGFMARGDMQEKMANTVFALEVGQVSKPIATALGFFIFRVNEKQAHNQVSLEQVSRKLRDYLRSIKQNQAVDTLIKRLAQENKVEVLIPYRENRLAP